MANEAIEWRGGDAANEIVPAGSGVNDTLGLFGEAGFGFSVQVGQYQDNCFSTNDDGTVDSGQLPNLKFSGVDSAFVANEGSATSLTGVQLSEATLRIRLTSDDNIITQNTNFRAFDGSDIDVDPVGVTNQAFELLGATSGSGQDATDFNTLGDTTWTEIKGSGDVLSLGNQPFSSGVHDFYLGISAKPNSVGSKSYGFYWESEFL